MKKSRKKLNVQFVHDERGYCLKSWEDQLHMRKDMYDDVQPFAYKGITADGDFVFICKKLRKRAICSGEIFSHLSLSGPTDFILILSMFEGAGRWLEEIPLQEYWLKTIPVIDIVESALLNNPIGLKLREFGYIISEEVPNAR